MSDLQYSQAGETAIEARNISKTYGATTALNNISLQLSGAEKTAIIGPSGAGKTSLLKMLSGALSPSSGHIAINYPAMQTSGSLGVNGGNGQIAFIPQDFGLTPNLSVAQNIACGRLGRLGFWQGCCSVLFPSKVELESIYQLLDKLGIAETLYKSAAQLSGGESQRVAIARALYQQASILFADEPVASLDPERAESSLRLLTRLCEERHLMLCVSLHNLELAKRFFDRLIGLREGEIIFDVSPAQLNGEDLAKLYAARFASQNYERRDYALA